VASPEDFPKLLDRMGECMRTPYDWSEDVKKLEMGERIGKHFHDTH